MLELSACIEMLFTEKARALPDRIRAAADVGIRVVEFWGREGRDLTAIARSLGDSGVSLAAFSSEPGGRLVDPATRERFVTGVRDSCAVASALGSPNLIVLTGDELPEVPRERQADAVVAALREAAPIAESAGVTLVLEALNTRVDHAGYFLSSTLEALAIVQRVGSPRVRLLYDVYHSVVMDESPEEILPLIAGHIGHVHVADTPGRHQPGTGVIDWPRFFAALKDVGYKGRVGLEYKPVGETAESLPQIRSMVYSGPSAV
ncbi:MAG TPA: TIM barrel protein [Candidatus Dormibacteraeota bacterium]|jgi:hydroxypyruvate isomerase|nr:TIM barrel protein [Candidatus Dormibacteraeota bacterium]